MPYFGKPTLADCYSLVSQYGPRVEQLHASLTRILPAWEARDIFRAQRAVRDVRALRERWGHAVVAVKKVKVDKVGGPALTVAPKEYQALAEAVMRELPTLEARVRGVRGLVGRGRPREASFGIDWETPGASIGDDDSSGGGTFQNNAPATLPTNPVTKENAVPDWGLNMPPGPLPITSPSPQKAIDSSTAQSFYEWSDPNKPGLGGKLDALGSAVARTVTGGPADPGINTQNTAPANQPPNNPNAWANKLPEAVDHFLADPLSNPWVIGGLVLGGLGLIVYTVGQGALLVRALQR